MSEHRFSSQEPEDEPKLIIDEDWKTQVEREKELLKKQKEQPDPQSAHSDSHPSPAFQSAAPETKHSEVDPPPPASFEYLISGLATQAVAAMGQLPDGEGEMFPLNLDYARHYIGLLGVIESKTQGNLTPHESRFLQDSLHQLRMIYVEIAKHDQSST